MYRKARKTASIVLTAFLFVIPACSAFAATYHVAKIGNDTTGNGSFTNPWLTINKCASVAIAGDICSVGPGLYEERLNAPKSGTEGAPITFAAKPGAEATLRQVNIENKKYVRVVGFTITHNSLTYNHGVTLYNAEHCDVLDNTIHHVYGQGIRNNNTYPSSYNVVRGNKISYTYCPSGVASYCKGDIGINLVGDSNLIEYNEISHTFDALNTQGQYNIIRNNYIHDHKDSDFPDTPPNQAHIDSWQTGGKIGVINKRHVLENNLLKDNIESNSHAFQYRDAVGAGDRDVIVRGNVGMRFGSYIAQFGAVSYTHMYNNTFSDFFYNKSKDWAAIGYNNEGTATSVGNHNLNNIYQRINRPDGRIFSISEGSSVTASNNVCLESGTHASCVSYSGLALTDPAADDLTLQGNSSARGAGKAITTVVSPSGSGSSLVVADAGFFIDGGGMVTGDSVRVGTNDPTTITAVNYDTNTLSLSRSITWSSGDGVVLSHQSPTPDVGAYPYSSEGVSFAIQIESPPNGAYVGRSAEITASVSNHNNVRVVVFYVDGIPMATVERAPFTFTWRPEGVDERSHEIEARAYSFYPADILFRVSKVDLTVSNRLAPPENLKVN